MIKKVLGLAFSMLLTASCLLAQNGKSITVTGKVKFPDPTKKYPIYLGHYVGEGFAKTFKPIDSTSLKADSTFSFTVKTEHPDFYQVRVYYDGRIDFWADKDNLKMTFRGIDTSKYRVKNPPHVRIEGSEDNEVINQTNFADYRNYQDMIARAQEQYRAGLSKDSLWKAAADKRFDALYVDMDERIRYIVEMYKDKPTVLYALRYLSTKRDLPLIMSTLDNLTKKYPWLTQAQKQKEEILAAIAQAQKIANGKMAPDFAYPDVNGKKWSPKDFRGKYLIIDFWASWCGPCRQEIPHLKEVYKKYQSKGLDILAVSVDAKEKDWLKALGEEKMAWPQVNVKESKPVMADYLFSGIPYLVVVDKKGNIIEKNLRGESLDKKLKELFGF